MKKLSGDEQKNFFQKMLKGQQRGQLNQNAVHNQPNIGLSMFGMGAGGQAAMFNNNQPNMRPAANAMGSFFAQGMFGSQANSQAVLNMFAGGGHRGPMPVRGAAPSPFSAMMGPYPGMGGPPPHGMGGPPNPFGMMAAPQQGYRQY